MNENVTRLTLIYDKAAEHHRYFLSWRQYLFAGIFVITATLFYSGYGLLKDAEFYQLAPVPFLINGLISILFFFIEKRNNVLYHICQRVSRNIEMQLFRINNDEWNNYKSIALFFRLSKSYKKPANFISHSFLICTTYSIITIVSFFLFMIILIKYTFNICPCGL